MSSHRIQGKNRQRGCFAIRIFFFFFVFPIEPTKNYCRKMKRVTKVLTRKNIRNSGLEKNIMKNFADLTCPPLPIRIEIGIFYDVRPYFSGKTEYLSTHTQP